MANAPTLIIGNKNYSSWSLRPWLLLRQFGIAFDELLLPLDTPEYYQRIGAYSPTGRVRSACVFADAASRSTMSLQVT